jgi:hypothetical protein
MPREIDTLNRFGVCTRITRAQALADPPQPPDIVLLLPPARGQIIQADVALTLAAWIVAIVGDRERFDEILKAVEAT